MKRIVCAALVALIAVAAFGQAAKLPDLKGRTVRAVTENDFTPLNFVDPKTGKAVGWEYDAVNEIGKRVNAKIVWNISSWDTMIQAVRDGQFDVGMDGISITDDRKKQVDFSDPYMVSQQFMLVRKDETRFTNARGARREREASHRLPGRHHQLLRGRVQRPGRQRAATRGSSCSRPSAPRCRRSLAGDVDCVLMDAAIRQGLHRRQPGQAQDRRRAAGHGRLRFHLQAGSDLVAAFNAAIKSMKDDGTLDKLTTKWFYRVQPELDGAAGRRRANRGVPRREHLLPFADRLKRLPFWLLGVDPARGPDSLEHREQERLPHHLPRDGERPPHHALGVPGGLLLSPSSSGSSSACAGSPLPAWCGRSPPSGWRSCGACPCWSSCTISPSSAHRASWRGINFLLSPLVKAGIMPPLSIRGIDFSWRAIIALTLGYGAFISEIFRAGIESIHAGQWEAAFALGLRRGQVMVRIVASPGGAQRPAARWATSLSP